MIGQPPQPRSASETARREAGRAGCTGLAIFLVLAADCSVLSSALTAVVDGLSGVLPGAAPLLEGARRYPWLGSAAFGVLLASLVV